MWRIFLVMGLFGLTACGLVRERFTPTPDLSKVTLPPQRLVEPVQALLENETLLVVMADGTQCRGTAGAAFTSAGWTGVLSECATTYNYSVQLASGILPEPTYLGRVTVDLVPDEDEVPFKPLAAALVTLPNGARYRFETREGF